MKLRITLLGVVLLALAVRVAVIVWTRHAGALFDAGDYQRLALSIKSGHGFGHSLYAAGPSAYRPPAYPFFLAGVYSVFGLSHTAARLIEGVLGITTVLSIGAIGWSLWGARAGLVAAVISAIFLPLAVSSVSLVSESIFIPVMMAAFALVLHARNSRHAVLLCAGAGLALGLAAITRSNGALLVIPLLLLTVRLGARPSLALVAVAAVVLVPWTIRNAEALHGFQPVSTELGPTLADAYNSEALVHPGTYFNPAQTTNYGHFFSVVRHGVHYAPVNEIRVDSELRSAALTFALDHPLLIARTVKANLARFFGPGPDAEQPGYGRLSQVMFLSVLVLAAVSVLVLRRRRMPLALWITFAMLLLPLLSINGDIRFQASFDPFLILLAAAVISDLWMRRFGNHQDDRADLSAGEADAVRREPVPAGHDDRRGH